MPKQLTPEEQEFAQAFGTLYATYQQKGINNKRLKKIIREFVLTYEGKRQKEVQENFA